MDTTTEASPDDVVPPPPPPPTRRLLRDSDDRVLGGVAAGIADYFSIDPILVRLGFVAAAFLGGIGVLAYIVGWIAIPSDLPSDEPTTRRDHRQLIGYGLVALGLAVIPGSFGFDWDGAAFWPLALIAIGAAVLWLRTRDSKEPPRDDDSSRSPPQAPPSTDLVPVVAAVMSHPASPSDASPTPPPSVAAEDATSAASVAQPQRPRRVRRAPRPPRPSSPLGAITVSALLVLAGGAWLLDLADVITLDIGVVFAIALALVGAALIASAWFGRARGLIALGIVLALVVGAFGVIDVPLRGGIGDSTHRPRVVAALDHSYEMAIGRLTVDLHDVDFSGRRRTLTATLGIGKLEVVVPDGVRVVADAHAGAGTVIVFDRRTRDCCPVDVRRVRPGIAGGGTLRLTAEVGAGDVEIRTEESNGPS